MDTIGGKNVVYYKRADIKKTLDNDPKLIHHKKFIELFTGYIVSVLLEKDNGLNLMVGFPLKNIIKHNLPISGPSLLEIINNPNIIDDTDIDICIGDSDIYYPCQITRIISRGKRNIMYDDLLRILKKKLMVQPDNATILIINIECDIIIENDLLGAFLKERTIPYKYVFLVGKPTNDPGKFICYQVYPNLGMSEICDIGIPL